MILKKFTKKLKLKKLSEDKIIDNIIKYEKEKHSELVKIFHRKPQKLHQFYSNNAVIIHEDDEKYNGFFPQMKKYIKIQDKNIFEYNKKKNENKNFLKQYIGYKLYNKKICKDDTNTLYGDLLPLYNQKNFYFTNKFLSGKQIFQDCGLLIKNKRHLYDYYKKEDNTKSNKGKRDIDFMNQMNLILEEKIKKKKIQEQEKDWKILEKFSKIKKNKIDKNLEKYKRSKEYKLRKRAEAMKALELFMKNQKDIEDNKDYIKKIEKLIELEEKEKQKEQINEMNNTSENNPSSNNLENENNNSLFILNRYQNPKYNNKINATKIFPKTKSSIDIRSTIYKGTTTNSTINKYNETRQTIDFIPIKIKKRRSVNGNIYFSENTSENKLSFTQDNKEDNSNYLNINDTSTNKNPINFYRNIKQTLNNSSSVRFLSRYKPIENASSTQFDKNEDFSTITQQKKIGRNFLSDYSNTYNASTQKRARNIHKRRVRKFKSTFELSKYSEKLKDQEIKFNSTTLNNTSDEKGKNDLKWKLFMNLYNLNHKVQTRNNKKLKNFCDISTSIPRTITDKINKSFELDNQLKQGHIDFVKLLMEQKIMKYYDKDV